MARRKVKKSAARKAKKPAARKTKAGRTSVRKTKRSYDIPTGQPTGREVQAMHRLQVLEERYIAQGLSRPDPR
jgi:hypothetical protein